MDFVKSLCIALSTYTALPMPQFEWDERPLSLSFCFLPVAGVIIAALLWLWLKLCWWCGTGMLPASQNRVPRPALGPVGRDWVGLCAP